MPGVDFGFAMIRRIELWRPPPRRQEAHEDFPRGKARHAPSAWLEGTPDWHARSHQTSARPEV